MTDLEYLERYATEIEPLAFYRLVFPIGELEKKGVYENGKYNGIAVSIGQNKKIKRYTITDDLEKITEIQQTEEFALMSPISYAGKSRKSENARFLYALAIDLDGLKQEQYEGEPVGISTLFWQFDGKGKSNYLPKPTAIVYSGSGLHIYYVFEKPIPLFRNIVKQLQKYKNRLTWQLWTQGVSDLQDAVQYESLFQGFRMPGTVTKDGKRAKVFLIDDGKKVSMEYLNQFVPEEYKTNDFTYKSELTLGKAKQKYPEWYQNRVVDRRPKGTWVASRAVYDWWKRQIEAGAVEGHRYYCIMALATYAKKCGISREELEKDAIGMIDMLHARGKRADNPFTVDDVLTALESYNDSYITYPIRAIETRTGIRIERNKRNGRKQAQHLQLARGIRQLKGDMGENVSGGGRPEKANIVIEWRRQHPEGKKIDCHKETGLSRVTIDKWWNSGMERLGNEKD